jgi:hypothetical protein
MWLFDSPFFKDERIKWLLLVFFKTLDLGLFNEKSKISFGRGKLGSALEYPYYLGKNEPRLFFFFHTKLQKMT